MPKGTVLGFDFGMKRIGVAVGNQVTLSAKPLSPLKAKDGVPSWDLLQKMIREWQPEALIVGVPVHIDGGEQAITFAAKKFAKKLNARYQLPVFPVDERLTTVEARQMLFDEGGYKKLSEVSIDSHAAKLIVEQWLAEPREQ